MRERSKGRWRTRHTAPTIGERYVAGYHLCPGAQCLSVLEPSVTATAEWGFQRPGARPRTRTAAQLHRDENSADKVSRAQDVFLAAVIEILQSIRQSDMSPILQRIYSSPGGSEALDVLMKYMCVASSPGHPAEGKLLQRDCERRVLPCPTIDLTCQYGMEG
jgi:hypothetical protein